MRRRLFLKQTSAVLAGTAFGLPNASNSHAAESSSEPKINRDEVLRVINAHRPSRLAKLPADFNDRVGATHVAGKYHLTPQPFLLEGAEKLLALGTRLGKFWFEPNRVAGSYPFNSQWGKYKSFVELARAEYFQRLFELPFATLILEASTPAEEGWRQPGLPGEFYERVTREYYDLTTHLYRACRDRSVTIILQHWEGDWLLRGRGGAMWPPVPPDWRERCESMQRWLAARQAGVSKARDALARGAKCRVAHATEVNRVTDAWKDIPTVTRHVLPGVEVDLVSYSSYDALGDPVTFWKCLADLKQYARTGPLFGKNAVYVGEIGAPENEQPNRLAERWDEWMGVMLAMDVKYIAHWELYCNEFNPKLPQPPPTPVTDPSQVRGFWLVKPDGSLSVSGNYFHELWQRARK